jgi:hypothetical protein
MSEKIKIRYVGGDDCEHLESCKTWDDLSAEMESVVEFVTLKIALRQGLFLRVSTVRIMKPQLSSVLLSRNMMRKMRMTL